MRKELEHGEVDNSSIVGSDDFINFLLTNTKTGVSVIDRNYRLVRVSVTMVKLLEGVTGLPYRTNDLLIKDEMSDAMKQRWTEVIDRCFAGEKLEYQATYPVNGQPRQFQTALLPYVLNGDVHYVVNMSHDITDAQDKKHAVDQIERRFKALIEQSLDIKAMVDAEGITLYRSPASARVLGHTDEEMTGASAFRNIYPEDLPLAMKAFQASHRNPGKPERFDCRIFHKDGREVVLEGTLVNLLDVPDVNAMVVNAQDVTERRKAEREREEIAIDLVQRVKELEQFAYIVSHNLRSPVANILGIANALQTSGANDALRQQLLDGIFNATQRLDDVLRDLNHVLEVKHAINEKKESVSLTKIVNDVRASIDHIIERERVEISFDFSVVDALFTVRSYIHSIVYNLLTNAIKYGRPDTAPVVRIVSERLGGNVFLHFTDNGLGLNLDKNGDQLFGLYKRFHDHTEGKGVGLFMVKTQVEALGGRVTASNAIDGGLQFTVTLPDEQG